MILILAYLLAGCSISQKSGHSEVEAGIIDLTDWNFAENGIVKLDGKWEFYWDQALVPESFSHSKGKLTGYFDVPLYWHKYKELKLPIYGIATYRLKAMVNPSYNDLALKLPNITAAYKLWVNGALVTERGSIENNSYFMPFIRPTISKTFSGSSGSLDIVLQISNFIDPESGVSHSIELAQVNQLFEARNSKMINEAFMFGLCVIMAFYHFILYVFRNKNKEVLYFGLFCLTIGLRLITQGENIIGYIFPYMAYYIGSAILYGTAPLAVLFYTMYKKYLFIKYVNIKIVNLFLTVNMLYFICVIVTPMLFYGNIFYYYLLFMIVNGVYIMIYTVLKAIFKREKEAVIVIVGSIVLFITMINDILYFSQANDSGYLVSFGLFIFIFCQSLVIGRRFSHAFKNVEDLSERLIAMDKIKDEFLANTSHELRTPVNGIIGLSESLIDGATGELSDKTKENLEMIVSSGKRLASLINDILDFSKMKNKDIVLQRKSVDLRQTVNVVLTVVKSTYSDCEIEMNNNIPVNIRNVYGDENRIQQILYNLIVNSVKFTKDGYIQVSAEDKGSLIQVCVEDTGIGIPKEKSEAVFKSFEQVDSSISREYGGTGIGLSITKHLVELHGGDIWFESELEKGTRFYFTIPASDGNAELHNAVEENKAGSGFEKIYVEAAKEIASSVYIRADRQETKSNTRILIVDDEKINLQVLRNHLSNQQYQIDVASNGIDALEKIDNTEYDLILLDIMMPRMSGYEVCKILREKHSIYDLPIVLLTAKSQVQDLITGFEVGANDYLVKPFEKNELIARVKTLVSLKNAVKTAIENAKLFGEAKRLAEIDPLTGLNNRRRLFELAKDELDTVMRNRLELSLLMIDIDYFKNVNDTYGHDAGDIVLKQIADTIHKNLRSTDIIGRYGGEEFAVILPSTSHTSARITAEKIRKAVEVQGYQVDKHTKLKCTISIGVASYGDELKEIEQLVRKADELLYKAKENGRNRVEG